MQERWNFYLDAAKRMQEVDEDIARCGGSPHTERKAKLRKKLGARQARRVGLRSTRSNLLSVEEEEEEEEACDAFLAKLWNRPVANTLITEGLSLCVLCGR
eukprot:3325626-Amphidinium_carterae.2